VGKLVPVTWDGVLVERRSPRAARLNLDFGRLGSGHESTSTRLYSPGRLAVMDYGTWARKVFDLAKVHALCVCLGMYLD
jgi:hypothetical protein